MKKIPKQPNPKVSKRTIDNFKKTQKVKYWEVALFTIVSALFAFSMVYALTNIIG